MADGEEVCSQSYAAGDKEHLVEMFHRFDTAVWPIHTYASAGLGEFHLSAETSTGGYKEREYLAGVLFFFLGNHVRMCLESSNHSVLNGQNRDEYVLSVCDLSQSLRANLNRRDVLICILLGDDNCNSIDVP